MKVDLTRSQNADVLFAGWFALQAALMMAAAIYRPWAKGAYFDLGPGIFTVYGFLLPGVLYLGYILVVLLGQWWRKKSFTEAWGSLFAAKWGKRSAIAFGVAFLVNLGYYPWASVYS